MRWVDRTFGTWRGAVRLALSYGEVAAGVSAQKKPAPGDVARLVFVCHGNICRSAYAEALAARAGLRTASFGLSTDTGKPAHPPVIDYAKAQGLDLRAHRTTDARDFVPEPGDLLLGMETRHLRKLAARPELAGYPRMLLGSYAPLPFPHLHDPYELDPAYLPVCLTRIERAVAVLAERFPNRAVA